MATKLLEFEATELLYESRDTRVWRARAASGQSVILKLLEPAATSEAELAAFRREFELTARANGVPGVVRALALEELQASLLMVLDDIGGESLERRPLPLALQPFLELAVGLVDTVARLHQRRLIHKNITPSNIVVNPRTGEHRLIDFGAADELPQREVGLRPPAALEGTLAYLSPEQTGRMNRAVDYRTDFYSLGVTFYQLLTGRLPFEAEDVLGLVHAHIAVPPVPPSERDPRVPRTISRIVLKLMSKMADDRYQSGWGLKADLERCLRELVEEGHVSDFEPGQDDFVDHLRPPQKLYGREVEVGRLLEAFDEVAAGGRELVLLAGYAGVGKTSIVHEIHKPVLDRRGTFVEGKFDQLRRDLPYSGWIQAIEGFVAYLLMENESELARWKQNLLAAVGSSGRVLTDVIRNLEAVIGPQPDVPELGGAEAQNRFNYLFVGLVRAIAKEHPLVVFLDDLQWIDPASLRLLQTLVADSGVEGVLVIGAYRDNEVDALHPLTQAIEALRVERTKMNLLEVRNLSEPTVNELVADALREKRSRTAALARLISSKTQGNAFFTLQTLRSLSDRQAITFNVEARRWRWDVRAIERMQISDNVVALMVRKIETLEPKTRQLLPLAACMGFRFSLTNLATIARQSEEATRESLEPALREGLIVPASPEYQFIHDRVQQAAYSLIPEGDEKKVHLEIGRLLLRAPSERDHDEELFDIVDHLDIGAELLETGDEKLELARLNSRAGRKAKASAAFSTAARYFDAGVGILDEETWATDYDLALELHSLAAETASLSGLYERCDQLFAVVTRHARSAVDMVGVYQSKMHSQMSQGKLQEALEAALEILAKLGLALPSQPTADDVRAAMEHTKSLYAATAVEDLVRLPQMTDRTTLAVLRIASKATAAAYLGRPALFSLMTLTQVDLSMQFGNAIESPYVYSVYAIALCGSLRDFDIGSRFGNLALSLLETDNNLLYRSKTLEVTCGHVRHFREHLRMTLPALEEGYRSGLTVGDLEYAGYNAFFYCCHLYLAGVELRQVEQAMASYGEAVKRIRAESAYRWLWPYWQATRNLLRPSEKPWLLAGGISDQEQMLPVLQRTRHNAALAAFHVNSLLLCYLFGEYEEALASSELAEQNKDGMLGMFSHSVAIFYDSLTRLRLCASSDTSRRSRLLERVSENQRELKHLADHAPMNQLHRFCLVEAERMRVLGEDMSALDLYDRAILLARENRYTQEEALANELAGRFWIERHKADFARLYMQLAHEAYCRWQAAAKVQALEREFPEWLAPSAAPRPPSALGAIDLQTVMKAAQAISSEMELGRLLGTITRILIENAGAQRGFLLLEQDGEWVVAAKGEVGTTVETPRAVEVDESGPVSQNVVRFVSRTLEWVVLDDAATQGQFADDPHIRKVRPRSLLCAPLSSRGRLVGLLYLENDLVVGAFSRDRVELLKMLLAQAAVSLENARSYQALKESEANYRRLVRTATEGIWVVDPETHATFVNARVCEMLGYREEEIVGRPFSDFILAEEMPDHARRMETRRRGASESYERQFRRRDGGTILALVSATPLFDDEQRFLGSFAMLADITERKRAEEALRESDRRKSQFLAVLSHELRNPLAPIHNSLYILDRVPAGSVQARRAQTIIQRQVHHLTRLVDDLLDVTRITRGKIELSRQRLDLNELVSRVVEDHRFTFVEAGVQLEMRPAPAQAWVDGDPTRLTEVVGNLLSNAVRFTPRGGRTTVSIELDAVRRQAVVHVDDTGRGIDPEVLPRLFEALVQADTSLDRSKGGLGLGLALVKGLIEMHGGSVRAASEGVGRGASFTVALPLATALLLEPSRPAAAETAAARRVLVVEDNADAADSLRQVLEIHGHLVAVAHSGSEGLALVRAFRPDVVLCDIGLPEMDGYAVARALRADPRFGRMALVALTGYAQPEDIAKTRQAGFDAHIAKPPDLTALESVIASLPRQSPETSG